MQGCPEHLGEQSRVDTVADDLPEGLQQGGEGVLKGLGSVLPGERQAAVELEDRVVDRRVPGGEGEVRAGQSGDPGAWVLLRAGRRSE
ncbi:hypothetical protein EES44_25970 [Streptomyces sp. ADI96-15]|nr:hypothetical protein EES44_25970 [Streptomyces sp. ADI96-15]